MNGGSKKKNKKREPIIRYLMKHEGNGGEEERKRGRNPQREREREK